MRIYVEPAFLDHFLSLSATASKEVEILWNIINSYAEVSWVFNNSVSFEDFEKWETSSSFYSTISSKASNGVELKRDFQTDINSFKGIAQILLAEKEENWHKDIADKTIILTPENLEITIRNLSSKFSFKFIADQNNAWDEFDNLQSDLVSEITITDKYALASFLDKSKLEKFDNNFIYLINKLINSGKKKLKILIKSADADRGKHDDLKQKILNLSDYIKNKVHSGLEITVMNAELDSNFDFHDRNLFSPYYIVKTGKGFERLGKKAVNTEVECYSFLDKWGYDLIRHRYRMIKNYEESIATMNTPFKAITI